jgi:hypothetical protein
MSAAMSVAMFSLLPAQANDEGEKGAVEVQETGSGENADEQSAEVAEQDILVEVNPEAQVDEARVALDLAIDETAARGNQPLETRILRIDAAPAGDILAVQAQGDVAAGQVLAQLEGPGKYWIGIHLHEVSPALRSQLNLEEGHGILIGDVSPDSPASKAGVKQHDILLAVGDTKIGKNEDVLKVVKEADGKEIKLKVLRGGSERIVAVTPTERPEGKFTVVAPEGTAQDAIRWWQQVQPGGAGVFQPNANLEFNLVKPSPGVLLPGRHTYALARTELPEDLSITITREGKKPAKISVKQKERDIETTEDKVQELPEDLRRFVEPMLGRQRAALNLTPAPGGRPFNMRVAPRAVPPMQVAPPQQAKPADVLIPPPAGQEQRRVRVRALPPGGAPAAVEQRIEALERQLKELERAIKESDDKKDSAK